MALLKLSLQVGSQPSRLQDLPHRFRHSGERVFLVPMIELSFPQFDSDSIVLFDGRIQRRALDDRKSVVDRVPIESSGERTGYDSFDPQPDNRRGCLLPRTAATEISTRHKNFEVPQLCGELRPENFESVLTELFRIDANHVASRNNDVGIDVI